MRQENLAPSEPSERRGQEVAGGNRKTTTEGETGKQVEKVIRNCAEKLALEAGREKPAHPKGPPQ